jgi:hypothetical protein
MLEEQGDAALAEFIRLQCKRAVLTRLCDDETADWVFKKHPEYQTLVAREKKLLDDHRNDWLAGLPPEGNLEQGVELAYQFRRGFIRARLRLVEERYPDDLLDGLEAMSKLPAFARVAEVVLDFGGRNDRGGPIDDPAIFAHVLNHRALRHVTCLDLDDQFGIGDAVDLTLLATRRDLKRLTEFTAMAVYQEGAIFNVEVLGNGSGLSNLRKFAVGGPYLEHQIVPLANSRHFPRLESLNVHLYDCGDPAEVLRAFSRTKFFPNLRRIAAHGRDVNPSVVFAVLRSPWLPRLESLDYDLNDFDRADWNADDDGNRIYENAAAYVRELVAMPEVAKLRQLQLGGMNLRDKDFECVLSSPHLADLQFLGVFNNPLSKKVVKRLRERFPLVHANSV